MVALPGSLYPTENAILIATDKLANDIGFVNLTVDGTLYLAGLAIEGGIVITCKLLELRYNLIQRLGELKVVLILDTAKLANDLIQAVDELLMHILGTKSCTSLVIKEILVQVLQFCHLRVADGLFYINYQLGLLVTVGQTVVKVTVGNRTAIQAERDLVHFVELCQDAERSSLVPSIGIATELLHDVFHLRAYAQLFVAAQPIEYLL